MRSNESAEMYLETILLLKEKQPEVRAIDVVRQTGYSKPSVSRAVRLLKESRHIEVDESGYIWLTESGRALATRVVERHRCITELLVSIGVSHEVAALDACKMEHVISDETFEKLKEHLKRNRYQTKQDGAF